MRCLRKPGSWMLPEFSSHNGHVGFERIQNNRGGVCDGFKTKKIVSIRIIARLR